MAIDKNLVLDILTAIDEQAPKRVSVERLGLCDEHTLARHLIYMAQEGLIDNEANQVVGYDTEGEISCFESCTITALGISYLGQDDGIHQELNTVSIHLDEAVLRQLLINSIANNAEPDLQEQMIDGIKSLPKEVLVETLKEFVIKGIASGSVLASIASIISG